MILQLDIVRSLTPNRTSVTVRSLPLLTHWENSHSQERQIWRNIQRNLDSSFESMPTMLIHPQTEQMLIAQLQSLVFTNNLKQCKSTCLQLMKCVVSVVCTHLWYQHQHRIRRVHYWLFLCYCVKFHLKLTIVTATVCVCSWKCWCGLICTIRPGIALPRKGKLINWVHYTKKWNQYHQVHLPCDHIFVWNL